MKLLYAYNYELLVGSVLYVFVNIDSGNGLVPSGNKPLPESVLTQISAAIWCHYTTMS